MSVFAWQFFPLPSINGISESPVTLTQISRNIIGLTAGTWSKLCQSESLPASWGQDGKDSFFPLSRLSYKTMRQSYHCSSRSKMEEKPERCQKREDVSLLIRMWSDYLMLMKPWYSVNTEVNFPFAVLFCWFQPIHKHTCTFLY